MEKIYLLLGGNLGNRQKIFSETRIHLAQQIGTITEQSSIYETEPWGFDSPFSFWNQVIGINVSMTALEILPIIQNIERIIGRERSSIQYSSRSIDIDILFYGQQIINLPNLVVPHPRLQERKFALVPLNEITTELVHPVLLKNIGQILAECNDQLKVSKIGEH